MSKDFQIIQLTLDEEAIKKMDNRLRNQVVGCMHAHNELVILNRILMFSMNRTADGELHDSANSVQMWCFLQVLAAKLFETWKMLNERFLKANPEDPMIGHLKPEHKASLEWLKDYFGIEPNLKNNALKIIRDKTAFHYDKLNLEQAANSIAQGENTIYLAQHPANGLYYMGSALVFRSAFAMVADATRDTAGRSYDERTVDGFRIAVEDNKNANWHMHLVLYGLIEALFDKTLPQPLNTLEQVRINIQNAPDPEVVGLPTFIDIGNN